MNLETGTPTQDGRYIAYVEGHFGWLTPVIVTWATKWKFLHSQQDYTDKVYCWSGPLPVMSVAAWEKRGEETQFPDEPGPVEYDL